MQESETFLAKLWPGISISKYVGATVALTTAEIVLLYPIDLVRVRLQVSSLPQTFFASFAKTFQNQVSTYGMRRGLYHGLAFTTFANFPVHLLYIAVYNSILRQLEKRKESIIIPSVLLPGVAGAFAEIGSIIFKVPQDIITQKLQTEGIEKNLKSKHFIQSIWKEHKHVGFYTGTGATLATLLPSGMLWWIVFEGSKKQLNLLQNINQSHLNLNNDDHDKNDTSEISFGNLVIASTTAGIAASTLMNPFDICKTRIQTNLQTYGKKYTLSVMSKLITNEGVSSLTKGLIGRIGISIPMSIIGGLSYEIIIHFATVKNYIEK